MVGLVGFCSGAGLFFLAGAARPKAVVEPPAAPAPTWIDIVKPIQMYDLEAPELFKLPRRYEARRHRFGGGRQDMLVFGNPRDNAPYMQLGFYRIGQEAAPDAVFFVDLARLAADAGLGIGRTAQPAALQTRFGKIEIADVALTDSAGRSTPCIGFRGIGTGFAFRLGGFACGGVGKPMSRPTLACLIDRIDLVSAGEDQALAHYFADTELARDPSCAGMRLGPTLARASWLDQSSEAPALRGPRATGASGRGKSAAASRH